MRVLGPGHALFAATLVALGVWGLVIHGFAPIWTPAPKAWPHEPLIWATALVALACGLGLVWPRTGAGAAGVLAAVLVAWMVAVKVPPVVKAPLVVVTYENWGETAVLAAAAWALFSELGRGWKGAGALAGDMGLRLARSLYGLAMIAFGAAHLAYVKETAALVPPWLPAHVAWVWATGLAYIAAGVAILVSVAARLAATLSAAQIGLFTLLVWAPVAASGKAGADDWSEAVVSWSLTAAAWVIADTYRGQGWVAKPGRAKR